MINENNQSEMERDGYTVARQMFSTDEVARLTDHYMAMRASGTYPGDFAGVNIHDADPLKRFPRLIHMHRFDETSREWLLDSRIGDALTTLLGREPFAVQTMLYFKPAGARGQALHQDNFYLRVSPGTCMAAWLALDRCDEENGCMRVVPGSHKLPLLCTTTADTTQSFTDVTVPVPEDMEARPVPMEAGDVLFFNGSVIHGSYPNTSAHRFRRSLIGHYVAGEAQKVGQFYQPVLRFDGTEATLETSGGGGPCGVWADNANGARTVVLRDEAPPAVALHE